LKNNMEKSQIQNLIQDEITNTVPFMIEEQISSHQHEGGSSKILEGKNLSQAPQPSLTAQSVSISTGGTYSMKTSDATSIINIATRVAEIEARLKALGLIN